MRFARHRGAQRWLGRISKAPTFAQCQQAPSCCARAQFCGSTNRRAHTRGGVRLESVKTGAESAYKCQAGDGHCLYKKPHRFSDRRSSLRCFSFFSWKRPRWVSLVSLVTRFFWTSSLQGVSYFGQIRYMKFLSSWWYLLIIVLHFPYDKKLNSVDLNCSSGIGLYLSI